jgi:hypothetical protein
MESNIALMNKAEAVITELLTLARRHNKNNMLLQFALSRKTQSLIDDAGNKFNEAISKLQLGLAVTQLGVNLRIDENVTLLLRYVYIFTIYAKYTQTLHVHMMCNSST